jgi:penicillin-insensitive murein endopeptidase
VRWLVLLVLSGCVGPGFFTDGTSVSIGNFTRGALRRGSRLPVKGEGFVVPALWAARDSSWGTDEMVRLIRGAARRVAREYPGAVLSVGDLSLRGGGDSVLHRSHENGRDADLIFYAVDGQGKPAPPADSMPRYGLGDLRARDPGPQDHGVVYGAFSERWFDVPRNWALVRALVTQSETEIQYLFIHQRLKERLLQHAAEIGEDPSIIERADALLHQPGDSLPHDDHLHVRIFCAPGDRSQGCSDKGPVRWLKKRYKYMAPRDDAYDDLVAVIVRVLGRRENLFR